MCQADLPLEMVPVLLALGRALGEHMSAHRDASLEVHEQGVLDAVRQVGPRLLESVLKGATGGLDASARPVQARCPRCQRRQPVQSEAAAPDAAWRSAHRTRVAPLPSLWPGLESE